MIKEYDHVKWDAGRLGSTLSWSLNHPRSRGREHNIPVRFVTNQLKINEVYLR